MHAQNEMRDAVECALDMARDLGREGVGMVGFGVAHLLDGDGKTKELVPFANIITNYGDQYYSKMGAAGVGPAAPAGPTLVSRMKLGTGTTAPNKATAANEVIQTYIAGSVSAFDAGFASTAAVGGNNTGWNISYKTTWAAGTATNAAITEATITSSTADLAGAAGDTIARTTFAAINKTASDSLAITWTHKFLGA